MGKDVFPRFLPLEKGNLGAFEISVCVCLFFKAHFVVYLKQKSQSSVSGGQAGDKSAK